MKCTWRPGHAPHEAAWRISVPADPWPLQYGCDSHLPGLVQSMGGDVRITLLLPGMATPEARGYLDAGRRLKVATDPELPPDVEALRVIDVPTLADATVADRQPLAGRCPRVSHLDRPCRLGDTRQEHVVGHETSQVKGEVQRWQVDDRDLDRWRVCPSRYDDGRLRCDLDDDADAHDGRVHRARTAGVTCRWLIDPGEHRRWDAQTAAPDDPGHG